MVNLSESIASTVWSDDGEIIQTPAESNAGENNHTYEHEFDEKFNETLLEIHPLPEKDGVLISVCPPRITQVNIDHVPCDIVLVIDVSGSMTANAPVPTNDPVKENSGLTILDLTKHAARTIIETLDENDRLGIITFADQAKVIQKLTPMTLKNKKATCNRINALHVEGLTNLWHGLVQSIKMFEKERRINCVPAIMVLTDGQPNLMCPQQGYIPKLRTYDIPASINAFGFGNSINSGLLKSIAEFGEGNYAFIPDAGMIGTVFIHAIAHLQSTYATSTTLKVWTSNGLGLAESIGDYVRREGDKLTESSQLLGTQLSIPLGNLQYGHSRDILLKYGPCDEIQLLNQKIYGTLQFRPIDQPPNIISVSRYASDSTDMPAELLNYHRSRSDICAFLSSIAPISTNYTRIPISAEMLSKKRADLAAIISNLKRRNTKDELNSSLLEDICGPEPSGQISLAMKKEFYDRWGKHYLLSIYNAHSKQHCNSFKDPGPLKYGRDSPLFIKCRDKLDHAFDNLEAPIPSRRPQALTNNSGSMPGWSWWNSSPVQSSRITSMRSYNSPSNPCFAEDCMVTLWGGQKAKMNQLHNGTCVWTPKGKRNILAVVKTIVENQAMCKIGDLLITPWHPICLNGNWVFPNDNAQDKLQYTGAIYSLLLVPDQDSDAHSIEVDGNLAVTLGHGITIAGQNIDVRKHEFFGDYAKVFSSLSRLPVSMEGIILSNGVKKDKGTGLVCGFLDAPLATCTRRE